MYLGGYQPKCTPNLAVTMTTTDHESSRNIRKPIAVISWTVCVRTRCLVDVTVCSVFKNDFRSVFTLCNPNIYSNFPLRMKVPYINIKVCTKLSSKLVFGSANGY